MQRQWKYSTGIAVALLLVLLPQQPAPAQGQRGPGTEAPQAQAPAPGTPGPYKAIAITLPEPSKDASLDAFRKQLGGIAERKDRAALARLIVRQGFFWERESGNGADPNKTGIANLAAAIGLDNAEDPDAGWDTILIYAEDPTVFGLSDRPGVVCGPSDPGFNEDEFQALLDATRTDISSWIYPVARGIDLRAAPRADAPSMEKVALTFIRVLGSDAAGQANPAAGDFVRVMLPSGKVGFVRIADIASLGVGQLCYLKEDGAWKIAGVIGGADE
jgi:hypothetical protein